MLKNSLSRYFIRLSLHSSRSQKSFERNANNTRSLFSTVVLHEMLTFSENRRSHFPKNSRPQSMATVRTVDKQFTEDNRGLFPLLCKLNAYNHRRAREKKSYRKR